MHLLCPGGMSDLAASQPGFGIYVHWPFCRAKCPYCDFNSHVRHQPVDAMGFARAIAREMEGLAARTPGRLVSSVFFGGGTPSLMPPAAVAAVLDAIAANWAVAPDVEVTLEANPTSAEAENFSGYRSAGVNRASVGVQALNDRDLKALGRQHTAQEALAAFALASQVFPRTSFDLIYARPGQSVAEWRGELRQALAHTSRATCRSTSSPSSPARCLPNSPPAGLCTRRARTPPPISSR
jgi:coproporphyrinogen III oxidase-like Fe-S oxidoreductase